MTPDGFGDSVKGEYFVTPFEEDMTFETFVSILTKKVPRSGVHYCQHQNSSLTTQFNALMADMKIPSFAREAFGSEPDASNFWMGDESAISSSHHDPYENIYCVVTGEKHFTLHPPTDLNWLGQTWFKKARFEKTEAGEFKIVADPSGELVPWFPVDSESPSPSLQSQYPHARHDRATPLRVTVRAGETLYLPSLWYHRVSQRPDAEGRTIAINFWFDMAFDFKYSYFRFMERLMNTRRPKVMGKPAPITVPKAASSSSTSSGDKESKKVPTPVLPANTVAVSGVNPHDPSERDMIISGIKVRVRDKTDEEMARDAAVSSLIRQWQEEKAKATGGDSVAPMSAKQRAQAAFATLQQMEANESTSTSTPSTSVAATTSDVNETKIWLPPPGEVLHMDTKKQLEDQVRAMLERWEYENEQRQRTKNASSSATPP